MDVLFFNRLQLVVFRKSSLLCAFLVLCLLSLPVSYCMPLSNSCLFSYLFMALIMCYGTVVYSVSEGDVGYHPRLRSYWITIRELRVASYTGEMKNRFQITSREIRCRYGTRTALRSATTPPCYHTPYYRYHTPWYRIFLECGSETPLQPVLSHLILLHSLLPAWSVAAKTCNQPLLSHPLLSHPVCLECGSKSHLKPLLLSPPMLPYHRSVSLVRAPPSAYSYKFVRTFSCAQIDLRKARERELATLDEKNRRAVSGIAEPYVR